MVRLMADDLADLLEHLDRPVVGALRGSGVQHDDVGHLHGALDGALDGVVVVGHDVEGDEDAAPCFDLSLDDEAVRLERASRPRVFLGDAVGVGDVRRDEFVAGGDERDARPGEYGDYASACACDDGGDVRRDDRARLRHDVVAFGVRARGLGSRELLARRSVDFDALLVFRHRDVLYDDGGVESGGHGDAGVGELPVDAAHPAARVGHDAFAEALEGGPMHGDGVHAAGEHVGNVRASAHVAGEHAPVRVGKRDLLDGALRLCHASRLALLGRCVRGVERAAGEHLSDGVVARKLDVMGVVSHGCNPSSQEFSSSSRLRRVDSSVRPKPLDPARTVGSQRGSSPANRGSPWN